MPTEPTFHHLFGGDRPDATPLQRAQEVMYDAWENPDPTQQVRLARQALTISPDCADAYVLLAGYAPGRREALDLFRQGVAAGERALGEEFFRENAGHFWGILETRPYMRARHGLAEALWTSGERDEAVTHLQEMLRLNPNDNQGLRYELAAWLLALDRDDELDKLLERYDQDASAFFAYTAALSAFRRHGDSAESRAKLKAAKKANKHVPAYLLRDKPLPEEPPPYYGLGDENEAVYYSGNNLAAWRGTPGAIDWLRAHAGTKKRQKARTKPLPPASVLKRIKALPQSEASWVVGARRLPIWVPEGGGMVRPWATVIALGDGSRVVGHDVTTGRPTERDVWPVLARAMVKPAAGKPHRPRAVQAGPGIDWPKVEPHLAGVGVPVEPLADQTVLDEVLAGLSRTVGGEGLPGLLDQAGVTPERVASVFDAAADYFEQAPWRMVGFESAIKIEHPGVPGGPRYGVVMGQSGMTYGLALYDDLKILRCQWAESASDEENARKTVATTLTFGDPWETAVADVEAAEEHGWRVARPDAFPSIFRKERGTSMRSPRVPELELLEAALRAVPVFVARCKQDDATPETITVGTAGGEVKVTLSWVPQ